MSASSSPAESRSRNALAWAEPAIPSSRRSTLFGVSTNGFARCWSQSYTSSSTLIVGNVVNLSVVTT